jgi:Nuclease-related domain
VSRKAESRRAGAYADQRYKQSRRNYRLKARPILAGVFGPFILAGCAFLVVEGHPLTWVSGMVTGAFAAGWFILRDEPPAYIEHWREGAEGERKTEEALKPLQRSGLRVVHDVQMRYGNYDHIAVGRAGVFLLETKNPKGIVELRAGVPYVRRRLDPDADNREDQIRPRALSAAARLKKEIEQRTGHGIWVQAVVVFWADFPEGVVEDGRCIFIHGPRLQAWMQRRPEFLDQVKVDEIAAAIALIGSNELPEINASVTEQRTLQLPRVVRPGGRSE